MTERAARDRRFHDLTASHYHGTVVEPRAMANDALFGSFSGLLPARPDGIRLLDLCAGTGHMALRLANRCRSMTLVDHSHSMLSEAQARLAPANADVRIEVADVVEWAANAAASGMVFDLVTTVGLLHHLDQNDLSALAGSVRALIADGGRWLLAEPVRTTAPEPRMLSAWNRRYREAFQLPWAGVEEPDEGPLDPADVERMIASAGLTCVHQRRGWEVFPRGGSMDRLMVPLLDRLHRRSGPVHCGLYTA
jgi:ubiquinone/menaquinone biosynthesis C-methylase UbiE